MARGAKVYLELEEISMALGISGPWKGLKIWGAIVLCVGHNLPSWLRYLMLTDLHPLHLQFRHPCIEIVMELISESSELYRVQIEILLKNLFIR